MADSAPRSSIYAGDSWDWEATFSDYPASASWLAETIFLKPGEDAIKLKGTADGDAFDFAITPDASASMAPGVWTWAIRVWKGTVSKVVKTGKTTVRPNPSAIRPESHNEKCLRLVQAAMEERLEDVQEAISILGQDITKVSAGELERLMDRYQARVNDERRRLNRDITGERRRRGRIYLKG